MLFYSIEDLFKNIPSCKLREKSWYRMSVRSAFVKALTKCTAPFCTDLKYGKYIWYTSFLFYTFPPNKNTSRKMAFNRENFKLKRESFKANKTIFVSLVTRKYFNFNLECRYYIKFNMLSVDAKLIRKL